MKKLYLLHLKAIDFDHNLKLFQQEGDEKEKVVNNSSRNMISLSEIKLVNNKNGLKMKNHNQKYSQLYFSLIPEYESSDGDNEINYSEIDIYKQGEFINIINSSRV